jgi:hypothetical protein
MNPHAMAVVRHVETLVRLNEQLLSFAEQRYAAMSSRDTARLETIMTEERKVAQAVFEQERARRQAVVQLAQSLGHPVEKADTVKLSELIAWVDAPLQARLAEMSESLRTVVDRIRRRNHAATLLAQQMLPHFSELLEILLAGGPAGVSYTPGGRATRGSAPCMSVLDMQA